MRALAHAERMAIVACLREGSACVCHLTAALRRPQAYVSQQLAILRGAGLIKSYREGTFTYYRLTDRKVMRLLEIAGRVTGAQPRAAGPAGRARTARVATACNCPRCRGDRTASQRRPA
jgi:ArsR family transcriptional regulator